MLEIRIRARNWELGDEPFHPFRRHTWGFIGSAAITAATSIGSSLLNKSKAPATVPYQNVDPTQVQNNAIAGDISSLPSANQLSGATTTQTAQEALAARNITQPGYSNLAGALTGDATTLAQNPYQVPQSVVDQLSQYASENNISEGTGNASGFSQDNLLRSLGINSLQYGQTNMGLATSALSALSGTAPNVSPVSPLSFLLTPQNALSAVTNNNTQNQAIGQGAANASAAAANQNSANLWDTVSSQGGNLGSIVSSLLAPSGGGSSTGGSVNPAIAGYAAQVGAGNVG